MTISYSGNFIRLLRRWKGSVWKAVWKEMLAFLLLYYIVRLIIQLFATTAEQQKEVAQIIKTVDSFTGKIPLHFLLGFYVGQVVSRWWAQVQAVPWPDEVMVWTNSFFYKNENNTRIKRRTIARYLILCETLVFRNVSTRIRKRFPTVASLVKAGLMTEEEYSIYSKTIVENTRWQLPLQWIINGIVVPAVNSNEIPGAAAGTLIGKVNDFRNALRSIFMYDWVCIPLVYTQTCSVVVYGYFAFCLIGHQYMFLKDTTDLYFPFLTVLQFVFFVGWFKVAQDLMRPFGEDDDDVELNVVLDRHAAVAINFAEQICCTNPTLPLVEENKDLVTKPGGPDESKEEVTTNADGAGEELHPYLTLPYSRASLRYPKDHFPKMHAHIRLKRAEEEELIHSDANPFVIASEEDVAKHEATNNPYSKRSQKNQCSKNHF